MAATPDRAPAGSRVTTPPGSAVIPTWSGPCRTRHARGRHALVVTLAVLGLLGTQGCAAIGLTLLGVGAGISGGTGVSYTLDSVAYKAFAAPVETVQEATLRTLERMDVEVRDLEVQEEQSIESGLQIVAVAGDRTIEIELERLTAQLTRMRVVAKWGVFFKDRATAAEILAQTRRTLEEEPARTAATTRGRRRAPP